MNMFCRQCGTKNDDDMAFCTNCGARISVDNKTLNYTQPQNPPKKRNIGLIISVVAAVLVVLVGIAAEKLFQGKNNDNANLFDNSASSSEADMQAEIPTQNSEEERTPQPPEMQDQEQENSQEQNAEHTHAYKTSKIIDATCTREGYTLYRCTCGKDYKDDITDALGHEYNSTVIEATTEKRGYTLYACQRCGYSYEDSYTEQKPDTNQPENNPQGEKYTINHNDVTLRLGQEFKLTLKDEKGNVKNVKWMVEDPTVCSVSGNIITAKKVGFTKVKVTVDNVVYVCIVRVR